MFTDPPIITVTPKLIIVNTSSEPSISFTCEVFGIPIPLVTWTKQRSNTNNGMVQQTATGNNITSILMINIPRDPDESNYTCSGANNVTNVINTPEQETVELYVQGMLIYSYLCCHTV